jgi:hypothetical protein
MKKCVGTHADGRTSHVMSVHHDMKKLMSAKANRGGIAPNTQQKELKSLKSSKKLGGN